MSGISLMRPLNPKVGDLIQLNVEKGYRRFLKLVADSRNMSTEDVDKIAQGRVWTGTMAHKLGLVDQLGTLDDAVAAAAALASLEKWDVKLIEQALSNKDKLMKQFFGDTDARSVDNNNSPRTGVQQVMRLLNQQLSVLNQFNDPQYLYAHCQVCEIQ
jgi:protease-4